MPKLLLIETSTSLCSTALAQDDKIIATRVGNTPRIHASATAIFIKEMLDETGWKAADLDAVAVSAGPGSYTGLRVGVSTAKGICFGAGVPLIAVSTLDVLVWQGIDRGLLPEGCRTIIPMVDARRMEVFTAPYSAEGERRGDISAVVLDSESFASEFAAGPVLVIGDGAAKFEAIKCQHFIQACPEASAMLTPASRKYEKKEFEDVAYFEPFYLKQFIATTPKKLF